MMQSVMVLRYLALCCMMRLIVSSITEHGICVALTFVPDA